MPRIKIDGPDPRTRILTAARALFLKHGVSAVTNSMLAKEAKVSMSTLYNHVGDRSDILRAVVEQENQKFFGDLDHDVPKSQEMLRKALVDFGLSLLDLLNTPELVKFDRLMLSQAMKHPEMTQIFYESAYGQSYAYLEAMIEGGQEAGFIMRTGDPALLAGLLGRGWIGRPYEEALYGGAGYQKPKAAKKHVEHIMDVVLGL